MKNNIHFTLIALAFGGCFAIGFLVVASLGAYKHGVVMAAESMADAGADADGGETLVFRSSNVGPDGGVPFIFKRTDMPTQVITLEPAVLDILAQKDIRSRFTAHQCIPPRDRCVVVTIEIEDADGGPRELWKKEIQQ